MNSKNLTILQISLYKKQFGGERFVDYSLSSNYTLNSAILEQWPSQQIYDIQVEAITTWDKIVLNSTNLHAPTKPPSAPTNLKIYATQQVFNFLF